MTNSAVDSVLTVLFSTDKIGLLLWNFASEDYGKGLCSSLAAAFWALTSLTLSFHSVYKLNLHWRATVRFSSRARQCNRNGVKISSWAEISRFRFHLRPLANIMYNEQLNVGLHRQLEDHRLHPSLYDRTTTRRRNRKSLILQTNRSLTSAFSGRILISFNALGAYHY